mgnify:CR=1 FL=1|jgi:hypothetical protein
MCMTGSQRGWRLSTEQWGGSKSSQQQQQHTGVDVAPVGCHLSTASRGVVLGTKLHHSMLCALVSVGLLLKKVKVFQGDPEVLVVVRLRDHCEGDTLWCRTCMLHTVTRGRGKQHQ